MTGDLTDHVRQLVDTAPPLSADQRDQLTLILAGTGPTRDEGPPQRADATILETTAATITKRKGPHDSTP